MIQYIIMDMADALVYLLYGLVAGAAAALFLSALNAGRRKRGNRTLNVPAITLLVIYAVIILCITFLSRELGSRLRTIDLQLFSTWGRTEKSHALVIENILLFIPYGYLMVWNVRRLRGFWPVLLTGLFSSLGIETMQLLTGRGYFQIDDVITNTLGMLVGAGIFGVGCVWKRMREKFSRRGGSKRVSGE